MEFHGLLFDILDSYTKYFLDGSFLEKCGKISKNCHFSERLWPDWGNTARVATAGLGSKGLRFAVLPSVYLVGLPTKAEVQPLELVWLIGNPQTPYSKSSVASQK